MTGLFDDAREKGEITTALTSTRIYDFLQGLVFAMVKNWYQQKSMEDIDDAVDQILSFLGNGIGMSDK